MITGLTGGAPPTADDLSPRVLEAAQNAQRWLLESGVWLADPNDANHGAVYSYYDPKRQRHELIYAEATGYLLSLLRYLSETGGNAALGRRAAAAGDWLVRLAGRNGGVLTMGETASDEIAQAYAFDNGICCKGLLDLYEMSGQALYLACAERTAQWLIDDAMNGDGSVKPVLDTRAGGFTEDGSVWYKASGSFHGKIAMPLLQLYAITKQERLREAALRLCRWAIRQQLPDGRFPANSKMRAVNLHAHCYSVEALLYAYAVEGIEEFLQAAAAAARWMVGVQKSDGSFRLWYDEGSSRERASYPQAQAVRIFSLLHMRMPDAGFAEAGRQAAAALLTMQSTEPDPRAAGGFLEGDMLRYRLIYRKSRKSTSWATMFAIHALGLVDRVEARDFRAEVRRLF